MRLFSFLRNCRPVTLFNLVPAAPTVLASPVGSVDDVSDLNALSISAIPVDDVDIAVPSVNALANSATDYFVISSANFVLGSAFTSCIGSIL